MNEITTVGVDLAKDLFVVCAGDAQGLWSAEIRSGRSEEFGAAANSKAATSAWLLLRVTEFLRTTRRACRHSRGMPV